MTSNYHTHTTFCDGVSTPEQIVLCAVEKGFRSIGFSGHGYTPYDLRYCMQDTLGYIRAVSALKEKYGKEIEIYCGIEEDAFAYVKREDFDYIIGSCHYLKVNNKYYPIDSDGAYFSNLLATFDNNPTKLAEAYYSTFTDYIIKRRPDIVGHFDLITKFDENDSPLFLGDEGYFQIAHKYLKIAAASDVIFEINTGAMARGIRKTPYLGEKLLYTLKKSGGKVIISSDSHSAQTLDYGFDDMICLMREVGFDCMYEIVKGEFVKKQL